MIACHGVAGDIRYLEQVGSRKPAHRYDALQVPLTQGRKRSPSLWLRVTDADSQQLWEDTQITGPQEEGVGAKGCPAPALCPQTQTNAETTEVPHSPSRLDVSGGGLEMGREVPSLRAQSEEGGLDLPLLLAAVTFSKTAGRLTVGLQGQRRGQQCPRAELL